ncbi:tyrosine recombinase XerC [Ruegeria sp. HKCCA6837]|uniref:site-specific integrase n=1 Tax=Ruegeria sp. HKCCA6837 TaxID=2682989 RepID=UPI0014895227|nr:tyrosine-type recombinase/integrase [Ruegeria sp. HKCCA6837]
MAIVMKIKYLDKLKEGFRFKRRFPKDVAQVTGREFFQARFAVKEEGPALLREHAALLRDFEDTVRAARRQATGSEEVPPRERWYRALTEAERLVDELPHEDLRDVLADEMHKLGSDPMLLKAIRDPEAKPPSVTLADAKAVYETEKVRGKRSAQQQLDRTCRRIEDVLGPLDQMKLTELKREQARRLRDQMLKMHTTPDKLLSPSSVKRELRIISAMVNVGIKEFDLTNDAANPFQGLEVHQGETLAEEKRLPLSMGQMLAMSTRLSDHARSPDLRLIWDILIDTGCRLAEITGLTLDDVHLNADIPYIDIKPNSIRSIKTKVSVRRVPLKGRAPAAIEGAMKGREGASGGDPLFPSYGRPRGADSASQVLIKHLRTITPDNRLTVHSTRHAMKDRLRLAGVDPVVQKFALGHAASGVGETYGGPEARLKLVPEAFEKVM